MIILCGNGNRLDKDDTAARPEFAALTEAEVWAALENDGGGSISAEVTRLVAQHTIQLKSCADQHPSAPGVILQLRARCPIERVAILIVLDQEPSMMSLVTVN